MKQSLLGFLSTATASAVVVVAVMMPAAHAGTGADTSNLDHIIETLYDDVQSRCTPTLTPHFQRIDWDPGYPYGGGGSGRIVDDDPSLGGPFQVWWNLGPDPPNGYRSVPAEPQGYWDINLEFC